MTHRNYQLYILDDVDILSNCLMALAEFRRNKGDYWPSSITVHKRNRLSISFGPGIKLIRPADKDSNWLMINGLYMSTDRPLRDPAVVRKATRPPVSIRTPVEDVYNQVYRNRVSANYVLRLPAGG